MKVTVELEPHHVVCLVLATKISLAMVSLEEVRGTIKPPEKFRPDLLEAADLLIEALNSIAKP